MKAGFIEASVKAGRAVNMQGIVLSHLRVSQFESLSLLPRQQEKLIISKT